MHPARNPIRRIVEQQLDPGQADNDYQCQVRLLVGLLSVGLAGATVFPIWLAVGAPGSGFASVGLALLVTPLAIAALIIRTGRPQLGAYLSTLNLAGLVAWGCILTGGLGSPTILLFALIPFAARAAGAKDRRLVIVIAVAGLGVCITLDGLAPTLPWDSGWIGAVAGLVGIVVAGAWPSLGRTPVAAIRPDPVGQWAIDRAADMVTLHASDGGVAWASEAAREFLGVAPAALRGRGFAGLVHREDRPRLEVALAKAATEGGRAEIGYRAERRTGGSSEWLWMETRFRSIEPLDQPQGSVIGITREVTSRRAEIDQHRSAVARARADSRGAKHELERIRADIRAPIDSIIGFSELIIDLKPTGGNADNWRDFARLIRGAGEHLRNAMLDSGLDSGASEDHFDEELAVGAPINPPSSIEERRSA